MVLQCEWNYVQMQTYQHSAPVKMFLRTVTMKQYYNGNGARSEWRRNGHISNLYVHNWKFILIATVRNSAPKLVHTIEEEI